MLLFGDTILIGIGNIFHYICRYNNLMNMNYFLVITSEPDYALAYGSNNPDVDNALDMGEYIPPGLLNGPLHYIYHNDEEVPFDIFRSYDAITTLSGGTIISNKMKKLIDSYFPNTVQLLECDIECQGETATGFYVMNVYTKASCYNLVESVFTVSPVDFSKEFEKAVLTDGPLEEDGFAYDIVRSTEDNKIVVSDVFKDVVSANAINSLAFETGFEMEW